MIHFGGPSTVSHRLSLWIRRSPPPFATTTRASSHAFLSTTRKRPVRPQVIYSDNHLLAVNKPAGWIVHGDGGASSSPSSSSSSSSVSLLGYLQQNKLGGGAQHTLLLPLHRIDQPCTGVVLFAKTTQAATRLTRLWKDQQVKKSYLCLLEQSSANLKHLRKQSRRIRDSDGWNELGGWMIRSRRNGSVSMVPLDAHADDSTEGALKSQLRRVVLEWKLVVEYSSRHATERNTAARNRHQPPLLWVRTHMGARHMVRALLGRVGKSPIAGDLRYGARTATPDQSVSLHAWQVELPEALQLGSTSTTQRLYRAPLPPIWRDLFGMEAGAFEATTDGERTYQ